MIPRAIPSGCCSLSAAPAPAPGRHGRRHAGAYRPSASHRETTAQTPVFTAFVLFQVFNALNVRSEYGTIFTRQLWSNRPLWAALRAGRRAPGAGRLDALRTDAVRDDGAVRHGVGARCGRRRVDRRRRRAWQAGRSRLPDTPPSGRLCELRGATQRTAGRRRPRRGWPHPDRERESESDHLTQTRVVILMRCQERAPQSAAAVPAAVAVDRRGGRHDRAQDHRVAADRLGRPAVGRRRVGGQPRRRGRGDAGVALGAQARRRGARLRARKAEYFAAGVEGAMIVVAAFMIAATALPRLFTRSRSRPSGSASRSPPARR